VLYFKNLCLRLLLRIHSCFGVAVHRCDSAALSSWEDDCAFRFIEGVASCPFFPLAWVETLYHEQVSIIRLTAWFCSSEWCHGLVFDFLTGLWFEQLLNLFIKSIVTPFGYDAIVFGALMAALLETLPVIAVGVFHSFHQFLNFFVIVVYVHVYELI